LIIAVPQDPLIIAVPQDLLIIAVPQDPLIVAVPQDLLIRSISDQNVASPGIGGEVNAGWGIELCIGSTA
jgi:hypothetical protein